MSRRKNIIGKVVPEPRHVLPEKNEIVPEPRELLLSRKDKRTIINKIRHIVPEVSKKRGLVPG